MKMNKLFQVLVVGGAMLSTNGLLADQQNPTPAELDPESELVFCTEPNIEKYCEEACDGKLVAKEGLECCWGTSCETE